MAKLTQLASVSDPVVGDNFKTERCGEKVKNVRILHVDIAMLRRLVFEADNLCDALWSAVRFILEKE